MDVTLSPGAAIARRPAEIDLSGAGAAGPSFDLYLDLSASLGPAVSPMPEPTEPELSDRAALERVVGGRGDERADDRGDSQAKERVHDVGRSAETTQSEDGSGERSSADEASQITDASETADAVQLEEDAKTDSDSADESLAGAQAKTAEPKLVRPKATEHRVAASVVEVQTSVDDSVVAHVVDERDVNLDVRKADLKNVSQRIEAKVNPDLSADQVSGDALEEAITDEVAPEQLRQIRSKQTASKIAVDTATTASKEVSVDEMAHLKQEPVSQSQKSSKRSAPKGAVANALAAGKQSSAQSSNAAEWARLLQGETPSEKLGKAGQVRVSDSVQLSTKAVGRGVSVDAGGRAVGLSGPAQQANVKARPAEVARPSTPLSKSQLPEGVDEMSLLRQISDGIRLKGGRHRAEIRLNPQELGTVRVQLEMKGDAVRMVVNAEHAAVGEALQNGLDQLRRDLLAQGMHIEHVEVRNELSSEGGHGDHLHGDQGESRDDEAQDVQLTSGQTHDGQISVRA